MAVSHLLYNAQTSTHGKYVLSAVASVEGAKRSMAKVIRILWLMIDGDGSLASHYATMATRIGAADGATAKAIWDELNSANSKISTDASVSGVSAALEQLIYKLAV